MSIVYVLPILPPKLPEAEALSQEIGRLRQRFGGELVMVNPNTRLPRPLIPRLLFGWSRLAHLRRLGRNARLYHFFNPDPFPYPFLLALPQPVVYTITSGLDGTRPNVAFLRRMAAVTVPDARSLAQLRAWGLGNVHLQPPGIDTARFTHTPQVLTAGTPLRVTVASAPWTEEQFATKGFDALLAATASVPDLSLTLLWRGVLGEEMAQRIHAAGLAERVTLVDALADVNEILARVHATALVAARPGLVKSYPHSLLDSLAAGKPVLVSRAVPMSDYVEETGCGVVVETVSPATLVTGLAQLRSGYAGYVQVAQACGQRDFALDTALDAVDAIYRTLSPAADPMGHPS